MVMRYLDMEDCIVEVMRVELNSYDSDDGGGGDGRERRLRIRINSAALREPV